VATVKARVLEIDDSGLIDNTLCPCGELQMMSHTVDDLMSALHSTDDYGRSLYIIRRRTGSQVGFQSPSKLVLPNS